MGIPPRRAFPAAITQTPSSLWGAPRTCGYRCFRGWRHKLHTSCSSSAWRLYAVARWSEHLQQLISALSLPSCHHCPALPCLLEGKKEKSRKTHLHTSRIRDLVWSHSWGCYGDGQFWSWGAGAAGVRKALSWRVMARWVARVPEWLPTWENDWLIQPTLHTPAKPAGREASSSMLRWNITWPFSACSGGGLFPLRSNGPCKDVLKKGAIRLWGFWSWLIWRGAPFLL